MNPLAHSQRDAGASTITIETTLVKTIRVALAAMPPILIGILRDALGAEPDVDVVAEFGSIEELLLQVGRMGVDVTIVGEASPDNVSQPTQLLDASPKLRVLTITPTGSANRYDLYVGRLRLGEVAADTIVEGIRSEPPNGARGVEVLCRGTT